MNCISGSLPFGFQGPPLSKTIIDGPPMIHTSVTFAVVEIIINLNKQTNSCQFNVGHLYLYFLFYILIQITRF